MTRRPRPIAALCLALLSSIAPAQEPQAPAQARTARALPFDAKVDVTAAVKAANLRAVRNNQRLLLVFGSLECERCRELGLFLRDDMQIRRGLQDDFQLLAVDLAAPGATAALEAAQGRHEPRGVPYAAVLEPDGKLVAGQMTTPWWVEGHVDPGPIAAFLERWAPPDVAASARLDAAQRRAKGDGRLVFLEFGAAGRELTYKMDDFLTRDDVAPRMAKDFEVAKVDIDRFVGGQALLKKYNKGPRPTIPWCIILDSKGQPQVDSEGAEGNIGFPVTDPEIEHFMGMLKKPATRMTPDDLEGIEAALRDEAAKVLAVRRIRARNAAAVRPEKQ